MEENKKTYKRNINPDNRPGPKTVYDEHLNKILIVKITNTLSNKLEGHSKVLSKTQSEVIREFIESLPEDSETV